MILCAVRIARIDARMFLTRGSAAFLHKDFAVQKFYTHLKEPSSEFRVFRGWASRDDSYDCCFEIAGIAFRSPWRRILPGEATQMLAPAEDEPLSMQNWGCERCGNKTRFVISRALYLSVAKPSWATSCSGLEPNKIKLKWVAFMFSMDPSLSPL